MDSINRSSVTPNKSRLARTFAKVMNLRASSGVSMVDKFQKTKPHKRTFEEDEKLRNMAAMDAFIAKLFATISSLKAAYAQLQYAQSPYDPETIQSSDQIMVSDLKSLSELKQAYLKKHFDDSAPETILLAEIQEQKNLLKTFEITTKKLDSQSKLKDSEIIFLKEKLDDFRRENKTIERRLNSSGPLSSSSSQDNLDFSSLNPTNLFLALKQTVKSIRSLVKFMISEMEASNWDLNAAADSIHPGVVYWDKTHVCYAFESFVCKVMFDGFNLPEYSISGEFPSSPENKIRRRVFFDRFMELKSLKAREHMTWKPSSVFAEFCRVKYLQLVHPKMELSLFGNLNQRNLVIAGKLPETAFFTAFADVAKRVWLLHCLAFSFSGEAAVFQVAKGSRFSEVFMDGVNEEAFLSRESSPEVGFTVVPGLKVGKSVIQCQVYLI